jgi:hypothetical protein
VHDGIDAGQRNVETGYVQQMLDAVPVGCGDEPTTMIRAGPKVTEIPDPGKDVQRL